MKSVAVVMALCLVAADAYIPMGPLMAPRGNRIVGGSNAAATDAPYQISLNAKSWFGESHICGGSLLSATKVLTAAHCCDGSGAADLKVKYGGLDRTKLAQTREVSAVKMHNKWNTKTIDYDYCVLTLKTAAAEGNGVSFVKLATTRPANGAQVSLTGWGKTQGSSNTLPPALQIAQFDAVDRASCHAKWSDVNPVTESMICAAHDSRSGCNGDSGGPLVNAQKEQVGVVSWGANGCPANTRDRPTVYADVVTESAWIKSA